MKKSQILIYFSLMFMLFSCTKENSSAFTDINESEINKRQRTFNFTPITPCQASGLTFAISANCSGTPYATEILNAIQAYNNAPTSIFFTPASVATADIVFSCVPGTVCGQGSSLFPPSGSVGGLISLEVGWTSCPCTDPSNCNSTGTVVPACMLQRTVMHEIGHALGVVHNDDNDDNFNTHVDGTPDVDYDPGSVFNSGPSLNDNCEWCSSPCVFNSNDILTLQSLYPDVVLECECPQLFGPCACEEAIDISLPTIWEEEGCVPEDHFLTVCALGWAGDAQPDVTYSWTSTGSIVLESNSDGRCVDISVGTEGGTISVWIVNAECGTNSIHRTIEICEEDDGTVGTGGNGPGPKKGRPKDIE